MQPIFYKQRDYIYTFKLDLTNSIDVILKELQQESWSSDDAGYNQHSFTTRFRVRQVCSPILREIEKYVEHGEFKSLVLTELYKNQSFGAIWGVSPERMAKMTFIYGIFTKDLPTYSIRIHTDDRMHVVQGMIYFIPTDDPDQSTTFYTTFEGDNPMRIPTGPGAGYVAANTNNSWHTGKNFSDKDRYSLIFGIRLNL